MPGNLALLLGCLIAILSIGASWIFAEYSSVSTAPSLTAFLMEPLTVTAPDGPVSSAYAPFFLLRFVVPVTSLALATLFRSTARH